MTVLVTGAAGFIGMYTVKALLARGEAVLGVDNLNDYYSPALKQARLAAVSGNPGFSFAQVDLADWQALRGAVAGYSITGIIHLAAQAGVRYSIKNPGVYTASNLVGHSHMLELARQLGVSSMVYASSSSVYGGNAQIPFSEDHMADDPVSYYGATKKSNELMSNAYARLYGLSLTGLRFFTVYGPMGRPDMAYWIFADKIREHSPIRVFNQGKMSRDFTYIDDIVGGVLAAYDRPAADLGLEVPHRIYNLGNDSPEELMHLISLIETCFGESADRQFEPMQPGDVERTWANIDRARRELDFAPKISLAEGIGRFAHWYKGWVGMDNPGLGVG